MTAELDVFESVSTPFSGDCFGFSEALITRLPDLLLKSVKGRNLENAFDATLAPIFRGIAGQESSAGLFRPELGAVALGVTRLRDDGASDNWVLGQFAVAAFLGGAIDSINLKVDGAHPLCVAGRLLRADTFSVEGADGVLTVADESGDALLEVSAHDGPGPLAWRAREDAAIIRAGSMASVAVTRGEWADVWGVPDPLPRPPEGSAFNEQIEEAFELLQSVVPEYYLWTASILREVVAKTRPAPNATSSGSFLHNFGVVELCTPANVLETAEMLTHECSHQHYHLASWFTKMVADDAPDGYSILKNTARPLERILLGFHAFGNVLLMYHLLRERRANVDSGLLASRIDYATSLVRALYVQILERKTSLTRAGLSVFQPLASHLVDEQLIPDEKSALDSHVFGSETLMVE